MRALVTGATGFIGRHLVAELSSRRLEVISAGRGPGVDVPIEGIIGGRGADEIRRIRPDVIFHLAGDARSTDSSVLQAANADLAARLLDALAHSAVRATTVLIGSAAEYGRVVASHRPISEDDAGGHQSPYGASKRAQTAVALAAAAQGLPVVVARLFNVIGAGMGPHLQLAGIARRLAATETTPVFDAGPLDLVRDYVDVADVVRILPDLAAEPRARGQVVNVCSGVPFALRDLVDRMAALLPWPVAIVEGPRETPPPVPRVVGDPARLAALGFAAPAPDFGRLLPVIVAEALAELRHARRGPKV